MRSHLPSCIDEYLELSSGCSDERFRRLGSGDQLSFQRQLGKVRLCLKATGVPSTVEMGSAGVKVAPVIETAVDSAVVA